MFDQWTVRPATYNTKVTLELGEIVKSGIDIWDFTHKPFYDDVNEQAFFEQRFIDRFRFRQIGQETVGRFLHYFRAKYNELAPYYLDLYNSVKLMHSVEDPFQAYDLTETFQQNTQNTGKTIGKTESAQTFSDTPHNYTRGNMGNNLTSVGENEDDSTVDTTNTGNTSYTLTRKGNIGVQPLGQEIEAYRKALINVDEKFFDEFNNLFLLTY